VGRSIRIGISSCLLGQEVRYDGGHKYDPSLADMFGQPVEWVPICPEVEAGFGTPREPMHLVRVGGDVRLLTVTTGRDLTGDLDAFAVRRLDAIAREHLAGYVLKADSPSCGLERVKVYEHDAFERTGRGRFAAALVARYPDLPVEDEARLADPRLRRDFVDRVIAYSRRSG
jgi:uncharacterized protein YbbK (DUF523 family)